MGVEVGWREARGRGRAAGQVPEADDRQLRLGGQRLEVVALGAAPGEVRRQVDVHLDEPPEAARPEVLPGQPQLQRAPPARALEAELVEVELARDVVVVVVVRRRLRRRRRRRSGLAAAVVLGPAPPNVRSRSAPSRTTSPPMS